MSAFLSKSKYLAGLQCQKLLWFHYNDKKEIPAYDDQTQAIFDQGHEVGELAKKLFPGGIDVTWDQPLAQVISQSNELLTKRKPLFEAGFMFDGTYARVDVLNPVSDGEWDIIEVKSGTEVKSVNIHDVAFQRYCYEGAGVPIRKCFLMHVNNKYVRKGEIEPDGLLKRVDVTQKAAEAGVDIRNRVQDMLSTIALKKCPDVDIGPHCSDPYPCPLMEKCWNHVNKVENNVFSLFKLRAAKRWALYKDGVLRNDQLPKDYPLSRAQRIQIEAEKSGQPHISTRVISKFLSGLDYPLYLLDFETFQTAIPVIDGTQPYKQIPSQFSLHVVKNLVDEPEHHSWLWDGVGDPRAEILKRLQQLLGNTGTILAYYAPFEKKVLSSCAAAYPEYGDWLKLVLARVQDLLVPFKNFDVYYPCQHGTASLKAVLPALTGKTYKNLAIHDGGQASGEFMRVTFGKVSAADRQQVLQNLEEYCGQDTLAMLDILQRLERLQREA